MVGEDDQARRSLLAHDISKRIPNLLVKKHRFHFGPVPNLPKVEPDTDINQRKPYWQKLRFSEKDQWVIVLPYAGSATTYPKAGCFQIYLNTSMIPRANHIVDAAGKIDGDVEIVTVGEVEREVEANYDWDVERAGLNQAKERFGGRWKGCPSPRRTKWRLWSYKVSGKKVERHMEIT